MLLMTMAKTERTGLVRTSWPALQSSGMLRSTLGATLSLAGTKHALYIGYDIEDLLPPEYQREAIASEICTNSTAALETLLQAVSSYLSLTIVVYGDPIWMKGLMRKAIDAKLLVPRELWILVPTRPVNSSKFLTNDILANQHNIILLKGNSSGFNITGKRHKEGTCQIEMHRIIYNEVGVRWSPIGCGRVNDEGGSHVKLDLKTDAFQSPLNLNGHHINVGIVEKSPELRTIQNGKGTSSLVGFPIEVLSLLQKSYNFSYKITSIKGYGTKENGTWIGLVGAVADKKVGLGLSSLSMTYERHQVADFTEGLLLDSTYLMFPAKDTLKPIFIVFFVFSPAVWLCLVVFILFMGFCIYMTFNASTVNHQMSFPLAIGSAFRLIINQGVLIPISSTSRLAYLFGLLLSLIIYATYSGNLTAFLSIPRLQNYPRTAEEMLEQGYSPLITRGFVQHDLFKYSSLDTYQKLYQLAERRGSIYPFGRITHQSFLKRFKKGKVASIISASGVRYRQNTGAMANEPCSFFVEPTPLRSSFSHFILQKHSYFKTFFNDKIIKLRDMGILERIAKDHKAIHCISGKNTEGKSRKLSLSDLQGAFLLWLIGITLAALSFTVEFLYGKLHVKARVRYP